jgi:hypothetical protein
MELRPVPGLPTTHEVSLPLVTVSGPRVVVEMDDEYEGRFRLVFSTFQAVKVTTADCFDLPEEIELFPREVVEVLGSPWIAELRAALNRTDETATFMDKAMHFLIPGSDEYIEVVAWDVECKALPRSSAPGSA